MSNFIKNANWRYATKKFDTTKKVSNEDLDFGILKEILVLSRRLQFYKRRAPKLVSRIDPEAFSPSGSWVIFPFANDESEEIPK